MASKVSKFSTGFLTIAFLALSPIKVQAVAPAVIAVAVCVIAGGYNIFHKLWWWPKKPVKPPASNRSGSGNHTEKKKGEEEIDKKGANTYLRVNKINDKGLREPGEEGTNYEEGVWEGKETEEEKNGKRNRRPPASDKDTCRHGPLPSLNTCLYDGAAAR